MAFCSMFSVGTDRDTGMSFCCSTSQRYTITVLASLIVGVGQVCLLHCWWLG